MSRSAAHDARNAFLRDNSSDNELGRQLSVPTGEVVKKISRELGVTLKTEDIPNSDGGRLHFLGNSSAEKVILYFHGEHFHLVMKYPYHQAMHPLIDLSRRRLCLFCIRGTCEIHDSLPGKARGPGVNGARCLFGVWYAFLLDMYQRRIILTWFQDSPGRKNTPRSSRRPPKVCAMFSAKAIVRQT